MDAHEQFEADVIIFGGGCAGLWLLDALRRRGDRALLLEAGELGAGQTASAQGILHGGLKYSLAGLLSASARMVREMPAAWEASIAGRAEPHLSGMRSRAESCHLWRVASFKSWGSLLGAVAALQVRPVPLEEHEIPAALADCPRPVYQLAERVIDPTSLVEVLAERNRGLIWRIDAAEGLQFQRDGSGSESPVVELRHPAKGSPLRLRARQIVLAAGEGNALLRDKLGLSVDVMQRRPLRVPLVRGELPALNGHCVEGAKTRVTITTDVDRAGRTVWQLGGQVSEAGFELPRENFLQRAEQELKAVLPGWNGEQVEWTEFTVNRAERGTASGAMPGDVQIVRDGSVLTVWPTKLVMAPLLSARVLEMLAPTETRDPVAWQQQVASYDWPAPAVARPPWEKDLKWQSVS